MKGFGIYVKNDLLDPKHVENMDASVWLYLWLLDKMTSVNENGMGKVLGTKPITFSYIHEELGIAERTYNRWVSRLREFGYVNTLRTPHGLVFTVNKAEKIFKKRSARNGVSLEKSSATIVVSEKKVIRQNVQSDPPKRVKRTAKLADVIYDNTKTIHDNTITGRLKTPEIIDEIGTAFYQAIKALKLPVTNHTIIKAKIKSMAKEDDAVTIVKYLEFMRDKWVDLQLDYKPEINSALDIYTKRVAVKNAIERQINKQASKGKRVGKVR